MSDFFLERVTNPTKFPFSFVATRGRSVLTAALEWLKAAVFPAETAPISFLDRRPATASATPRSKRESNSRSTIKGLRAFLAIGGRNGYTHRHQDRHDVRLSEQARHDLDELQSRLGCATRAIAIEMILAAVANNAPLPLAGYQPSITAHVVGMDASGPYAR